MAQYYLQAKIFFAQPLHNTNLKSLTFVFVKLNSFPLKNTSLKF